LDASSADLFAKTNDRYRLCSTDRSGWFAVCRISKIEAAGDAACKAKQFVERRSMIADFRAKAAMDDASYPLFVLAQT
jgi:hypothetical protein